MQLIKPTKKYEKSWEEALDEFGKEGVGGFWNVDKKPTDISEYIERSSGYSKGINLPDYWVPATTFWLIDNDKFVGHCNIRHKLNEKLEKKGGNIGYAIRLTERNKGYGIKILELALKEAGKLGLKKALITSLDQNMASQKIIERNGGVLKDKIETDEGLICRYWIQL